MTFTGDPNSIQPDYWRDLYGEATITWVPPVSNYNYSENVAIRSSVNRTFRWEEVTINLDDVQEGALIDFTVPDSYVIQITPDIGWTNVLAMFGEDDELGLNNPHRKTIGPLSISAGTLTDNGDGTVTAIVTEKDFEEATIQGYSKYLWRVVPWANNNPGLGGLPEKFELISEIKSLDFSVDDIIKETRNPVQVITGKKSSLASITIDDENNPTIFVEQSDTTWRVQFSIDRPQVTFRIKASDSSGNIVGFHNVSIDYESFGQRNIHAWNAFDSHALLASVVRLPGEANESLRDRTKDAFFKRGGSNYTRLVYGTNRELGLNRIDDALALTISKDILGKSSESQVNISSTHTRLSIQAPSYIISDEKIRVDVYQNSIKTSKRIKDIISIKTESGRVLSKKEYLLLEKEDWNEIQLREKSKGIFSISYTYVEDILYSEYPTLGHVIKKIKEVKNPSGVTTLNVEVSPKISGIEPSSYIYQQNSSISQSQPITVLGVSNLGLFSISNEEWKLSFRDDESKYFDSNYYNYVLELKSQTNIEWGFVVADEDFWDPLESEFYGRTSLEVPMDLRLADYSLGAKIEDRLKFDPLEAYRMNYYYDHRLLKNQSFPKQVFRSGVGYKKDCVVTVESILVTEEESKVNQNPVIEEPENTINIEESAVQNIIIRF